jgi:hypothetical protein
MRSRPIGLAMAAIASSALALASLSCGGGDETGLPFGDVVSIEVKPAEVNLAVRTGAPLTQTFTAIATFPDGQTAPIDLVSWTSSNLSAGDVDSRGIFTSVDSNGGLTQIEATHLGVTGTASLRVVYTEDLLEDGLEAGVAEAFRAATPTEADAPTLAYPLDKVRVPRNLEGLGFLWRGGDTAAVQRLAFSSDITDISVFRQGTDRWYADADLWVRIAASNRSGEVVVYVESGDWDGSSLTNVTRGPPIQLTVNRLDARGSVLYWSTNDMGILRILAGETTATPFFSGDDTGVGCVGCHVMNNATDRMVVTLGGINGKFQVLDCSDPADPVVQVAENDVQRATFTTVSPDGTMMLGSKDGNFILFGMDDGLPIKTFELPDTYTQPDWSPTGDRIAAVRLAFGQEREFQFEGGEIVSFSYADGELGEPVVLVPTDGEHNYYYPAWSPDGEWLAYNRTIGSAYASPQAELYLTDKAGSQHIRLDIANGEGDLQNSYSRWGPLPDDDVLWLAYSSKRSYPLEVGMNPQIWLTAIDTKAAAAGEDPSSAPFWLPGQDVGSDNHLPKWWDQ